MKKTLLICLVCLSSAWTAYSQYTQIPDPGFEQALINLGVDSEGVLDGQVLTSDIEDIEELELGGVEFENLIGLEDFTSLKKLRLYYCSIGYSLDLSMATTLEDFLLYGDTDYIYTQLEVIYFNNNPNLKNILFIDDWVIQQIDLRGSDQYITELFLYYTPYRGEWQYRGTPYSATATITDQPKLCVIVTDPDAVRNREGNYATWFGYNINFTTDCTLSVSDFEIADFKIYPNPTKEFFQIETTAEMESISVYDLQGKKIKDYATNQQNYSVTDLASGLYFLKLKLKTGEGFMKKLLVD